MIVCIQYMCVYNCIVLNINYCVVFTGCCHCFHYTLLCRARQFQVRLENKYLKHHFICLRQMYSLLKKHFTRDVTNSQSLDPDLSVFNLKRFVRPPKVTKKENMVDSFVYVKYVTVVIRWFDNLNECANVSESWWDKLFSHTCGRKLLLRTTCSQYRCWEQLSHPLVAENNKLRFVYVKWR